MKKLLLSMLLFPLILGGCSLFNKKSNEQPQEEEGQVVVEDRYIEVSATELSLEVGEEYQIVITQLKKTIVLCQSNDESIAKITKEGLVTAVSPGETTLSISGGKDRYIVFVTVLPPEAKDSLQIVMVKTSFTISLDDEYTLPFTVKLGNEIVDNPTFTYAYEVEGIIAITGLNVTPLSAGTTKCVVTATYNELSISSSFNITVYWWVR